MDFVDKDDSHYNNKFIKRSKNKESFKKPHTNTYSYTGSRPCHENGVMQYNRMVNNDTVNYKAIDYAPNNDASRKTAAPMIVSLVNQRTNTQNHEKGIIKPPIIDKADMNRLIYLPEICKYMFLSNYYTVLNNQNELAIDKNIDTVINLGNYEMARGLYNKVYNIRLSDCRYVSFNNFMKVVNKVTNLINDCIRKGEFFVICCDKGVNRSVSMVIAYNLMNENRKISTLDQSEEYIINQKNDITWPVLNNYRFYHYLLIIKHKFNCM